jgi:polyhydroxyalkanoate synthase subunit PhaC
MAQQPGVEPEESVFERAAAAAMGGEIIGDPDPVQLLEGLRDVLQTEAVTRESLALIPELVKVWWGTSEVTLPKGDWRFADPTWNENPMYHRMAQAYVLWTGALQRALDAADLDWKRRERARFALMLLTAAWAPTNFLYGNPAALRRAFETGGWSLLRGLRNLLDDLIKNGGMPSQVDTSAFRVGENLAATPGAVVYRDEICEVLQYAPSTPTVRSRPFIMIPPEVNKYYFMDLAPGRSFTEYAVAQGVPYFTVVWRNPRPEHGHWGVEDYVKAQLQAIEIACDVTGSPDVSVFGLCAGGLTTALMLGHMAATGDRRVNSATFAVTMLEFDEPSTLAMMANERVLAQAAERAQRGEILDRLSVGRGFAWLRPNDLVWNYYVSNWLMGNAPPSFDILAWNNDGTGLPGQLNADLLGIFLRNTLAKPGAVTLLGTPIDLGAVTCDAYVVAGMTDHITPWIPCYATTRLLGGPSEFVLTSTGHIQTLVNPPGKPRASYFAGPKPVADAETWLKEATEHPGSWWPHWKEWILARSGDDRPAPTALGSSRFPAGEPAPGRYVHE